MDNPLPATQLVHDHHMTYHDVPKNVSELSLDDDKTLAADVVDLCCPPDARRTGALTILICDDEGRLLQPVVIDQVPHHVDASAGARILQHVLQVPGPNSSAIVAICRPGAFTTDNDRAWQVLAVEQCLALGVRLIGTYVVTPDQIMQMPEPIVIDQ